jgi:uncharacterized protein (DUF697 family)
MPVLNDLGFMWKSFSDINVDRLREEALVTPRLALVGTGDGPGLLQQYLHEGPHSAEQVLTAVPTYHLPLDPATLDDLAAYDLRLLLLDDPSQAQQDDVRSLLAHPKPLVMLVDAPQGAAVTLDPLGGAGPVDPSQPLSVIPCTLDDPEAVRRHLFPALIKQLAGREVALGRAYPGLRPAIVDKLIQDTCLTNAAYAFGTGMAEMVPGLGIPLAVADIIILTKNQLVMAYKIALAMGETGVWQEVLPQMASVVGAGFMWRQVARELVGFIPLGVVLKVAIAYAGTFATGKMIYHWYATGEKLRDQELKLLLAEARQQGQEYAAQLAERFRQDRPTEPRTGRRLLPRRWRSRKSTQERIQDGDFTMD